ncbi:hypothetical protein [Xylophilus sp. GOD-11R]|uniref:hypothetical protein n=1 Tax=Xylophilus sp. GOD-11R TaxID=3089814 RepID=UPI00298BF46A|nr:hypothetical protein [Xylophilus sp. GOD-11R]WPB56244.1 hypothetical protein R9X41_19180 [Xylophilus sp. GOD-11R]
MKKSIERGEANFRHTLQSMTQTDAEAVLTAGGLNQTPMVWHLMNSLDRNASRMLQQALETCPAAVTAHTFDGQVALHVAASHADAEALALILQRTRQVDVRDGEGGYPLYELARRARYLDGDEVIECVKLLTEAGADWTLTTGGQRDAAGACAHDKYLCNLVMGLPSYTTCLLEVLQANPKLKPADVLRLKDADLPPTRMNLIDLERTKRGLWPIYQADRDNVEDQRRCRALVARRSR